MIEDDRILSCKNVSNAIKKRYDLPDKKKEKASENIPSSVSYVLNSLGWDKPKDEIRNRPVSAHVFKKILKDYESSLSMYEELRYIQAKDSQYIDTGHIGTNNTSLSATFELPKGINKIQSISILGARPTASSNMFILQSFGNLNQGFSYFYKTQNIVPGTVVSEGVPYHLNAAYYQWYMDSVRKALFNSSGTLNTEKPLYLFTYNEMGSPAEITDIRFYDCKIYEFDTDASNEMLKRDFVPARRKSDNAVGMLDMVTSIFYENKGTGEFIAGPSIVPNEYIRLEYLSMNGKQYFDTEIVANQNFSARFTIQGDETTGKYAIFGARQYSGSGSTYSKAFGLWVVSGNKFRYDYSTNGTNMTYIKYTQKRDYECNKNLMFSNGHLIILNNTATFTTPYTVLIGATYGNSSDSDSNGVNNYRYSGKLYRFKLYNESVLVGDFVPVIKNGEVGLFETVNQKFHPNLGSGTCTAGPKLWYRG